MRIIKIKKEEFNGGLPAKAARKALRAGQSMFELLVAVFVIAIVLTALVSLVSTTVGNTTFSRERTQAANYTQEAVEWLRSERDKDWGVFRTRAGSTYPLGDLNWASSGSTVADTGFERQVELVELNPNTIEARVVTSWADSTGAHESRVTTYFTNWRTR